MKKFILPAFFALSFTAWSAPQPELTLDGSDAIIMTKVLDDATGTLSHADRKLLARLLKNDCKQTPGLKNIELKTGAISCHKSDITLGDISCEITTAKGAKKTIVDTQAYLLTSLLRDAGIEDSGAAGTMYDLAAAVECTVNPASLLDCGGDESGAKCVVTRAN